MVRDKLVDIRDAYGSSGPWQIIKSVIVTGDSSSFRFNADENWQYVEFDFHPKYTNAQWSGNYTLSSTEMIVDEGRIAMQQYRNVAQEVVVLANIAHEEGARKRILFGGNPAGYGNWT